MAGRPTDEFRDALTQAREAFDGREWVAARERFLDARSKGTLGPDDLAALADCAWWLGATDEALPLHQEAYRSYRDEGNARRASQVALVTAMTLALRGDDAQASGWMGRAVRLLRDEPACAEQGYLVYMDCERALGLAEFAAAAALAQEVHQIGERFADPNLLALGILAQGQVAVKQGRVAEGLALLDEAMVAAVSDALEPGWAGHIYCHLMLTCHELADVHRAAEWTEVTSSWCDSMPGAGPFMGICRVHRAQTLQVRGAWAEAEREVERVVGEVPHFHVDTVAEAHYRLGELRRQRNDVAGAEAAFRDAHLLGRDPQPGLALLRLAQRDTPSAVSLIGLALTRHAADPLARGGLLPAAVEIAVVADDLDAAGAAADELADIARTYGTAGLAARWKHAEGSVLLAEGRAAEAVPVLQEAVRSWMDLGAPYDAARAQVLLARAFEALGARDAGALELHAAAVSFERLGVKPPPNGSEPVRPAGGLSRREAEIVGLVAVGMTNADIASKLVLSVRTVERHLATAYRKLGFQGRNARAAAVGWALREQPMAAVLPDAPPGLPST